MLGWAEVDLLVQCPLMRSVQLALLLLTDTHFTGNLCLEMLLQGILVILLLELLATVLQSGVYTYKSILPPIPTILELQLYSEVYIEKSEIIKSIIHSMCSGLHKLIIIPT